ncbi:MAG: hypothetical protein NC829_00350 [Candidatus Omnitrophica bacterium]|nr:hypothetical protein [Candidatus Omnitrophota bacterium]
MFVHAVHFKVMPSQVKDYRKDSLMWARFAKKHKLTAYFTMKRLGHKNEYICAYQWKKKQDCDCFMKNLHDELVSKSKAKVTVLGYYNLTAIDKYK